MGYRVGTGVATALMNVQWPSNLTGYGVSTNYLKVASCLSHSWSPSSPLSWFCKIPYFLRDLQLARELHIAAVRVLLVINYSSSSNFVNYILMVILFIQIKWKSRNLKFIFYIWIEDISFFLLFSDFHLFKTSFCRETKFRNSKSRAFAEVCLLCLLFTQRHVFAI